MRCILKRSITFLVAAAFIIATFPISVLAADDETVLTSIYHSSAVSKVDVTGETTATLTVPYGSDDTIDLSDGLDINYDSSTYSSAIASFPANSEADVDGDGVEMLVTYQKNDDDTLYTTTYTIYVVRAKYTAPEFTGNIAKSGTASDGITFTDDEFSALYTQNDGGGISAIVIAGSNPSFGSLQLSGSDYDFESKISISNLENGKLTFAAISSGTVSYIAYAYASDDSDTEIGSAIISITINETSDDVDFTVTYSTDSDETLTFDEDDFEDAFEDATGDDLDYVIFTLPSSSYGVLYYNYTSSSSYSSKVTSSRKYYVDSSYYLSKVTFVPDDDYDGSVSITIKGYDDDGDYTTGTVKIIINEVDDDDFIVTYSMDSDETLTFDEDDFEDAFEDATGDDLDYVIFTLPSSSYGVLYYNYTSASSYSSKVTSSRKYYVDSSYYLSKVTFVPDDDYDGTVKITVKGYDDDGDYTTGTVKITVNEADDDDFIVTYSTDSDETLTFDEDDFEDAFDDATGDDLDYVKFTLPSSSYGVLYYNYTSSSSYGSKVSASTKYYVDSSSYLAKVTFVPKSSYDGTVKITVKGYDKDGDYTTGYVKITVKEADDDDFIVTYSIDSDETLTFDEDDFEDAFDDATGDDLDYVKFTLPSSSYGVLYYNYTSSSSYSSKVSASTKYYVDSSYYLSKVTFVPKSSYDGTVKITVKGYDEDGDYTTGTVKITVNEADDDDFIVTYSIDSDETLTFDEDDFEDAFDDATGDDLDYVKFTLPSSSYGVLYYNYTSSSSYSSKVSASTKYYVDSSYYLSKVTFVPKSSYDGTVKITVKGYDEDGDYTTGTVKITVNEVDDDDFIVKYTTYSDKAITFDASDLNDAFNDVADDTLYYVKFTLPSSSYGTLYYNYISTSSYGSKVSSSTKYYKSTSPYLSYVTFVPNSSYDGTIKITVTGYNDDGDDYSGIIYVYVIENNSYSEYFTDVGASYSWAADAIDTLYEKGVVYGTSSTSYNPSNYITRGDFMLMLYRALDFDATISGNFSDVDKSSYYYNAVAMAKALGIVKGDGAKFYPTTSITREDVMVIVARALEEAGISIASGTSSNLSSFTDKSSISSYATSAVATLVKANVIQGSTNKINPQSYITRAEMAVILNRIKEL